MTNRQNNRKAAASKTKATGASEAKVEAALEEMKADDAKTITIRSMLTYPLIATFKDVVNDEVGEFMLVPKDVQLDGETSPGRTTVKLSRWEAAKAANAALSKRVTGGELHEIKG